MESFIISGDSISSTAYINDVYSLNDVNSLGNTADIPIILTQVKCPQDIIQPEYADKLRKYKSQFIVSIILSVISVLVFTFLLIAFKTLLCILFVIACIICICAAVSASKNATRTFKDEIVKTALQSKYNDAYYNNTDQSVTPRLFESFRDEEIDPDYLSKTDLRHLVKRLDLGGKAWNSGVVSDEVQATCNNTRFRFFDTYLEKVTSNGKSTSRTNIFQGQVYIFPAHVQTSCNRLFMPTTSGADARMLHRYFDIINVYNYAAEIAPYYQITGIEKIADFFNRIKGNAVQSNDYLCQHDHNIETPEFMECMLKLYKQLGNALWSVRLVDGFFILVIKREKDFFEFSFTEDSTDAFKNLRSELTEMFTIADIVTSSLTKPVR